MAIIGITGSIGSGKSEVAKVFAENGAYVIDADVEAKALLNKGEEGYEAVVHAFGSGVLNEEGEIDKKRLASIIFSDVEKVRKIDQLIHPLVRKCIVRKLRELKERDGKATVVIDAPLLIEAGFHKMVDHVILVTPKDKKEALKRAAKRIGISVEEAKKRFAFQIPQEEKEKIADIVIFNDGTLDALRERAREVYGRILKKGG